MVPFLEACLCCLPASSDSPRLTPGKTFSHALPPTIGIMVINYVPSGWDYSRSVVSGTDRTDHVGGSYTGGPGSIVSEVIQNHISGQNLGVS
jgi:hypothetical protein